MRNVSGGATLMQPKAVVALSGGLDSAVTLFLARARGYRCHCITFRYGQRNATEIACARKIARVAGATLHIEPLALPWKGSSLLDRTLPLPHDRSMRQIRTGIPSTYVPARNTIFLSIATSYAEAIGAGAIYIGAHSDDASGYPDCRKEYLNAFRRVVRLGTKAGGAGRLRLSFPLIDKNKCAIIRLGQRLGVPFQYTRSCYAATVRPCGACDSCRLRAKGFREAGIADPAGGQHARA